MSRRLWALLLVLAFSIVMLTGCWEEPILEDEDFIPTENAPEEESGTDSDAMLPTAFTQPVRHATSCGLVSTFSA